jgi:hypothetical protein
METWHKVTLPAEECGINGKAMFMQREFERVFLGNPLKDAALFTNHDDRLENHFFYFTPVAASMSKILVEGFNGVPCPQPMFADDMALLVGHAGAREHLLRAVESS